MTTQEYIRELAAKGVTSVLTDLYIKTPKDGELVSPELYAKMMSGTERLSAYLELTQYGGVTNTPSQDYIEVGGLKWALENAGTDAENPNGRHYTWDEAMKLEDETWRLPTDEELEEFRKRTFFGFDEERGVGIFVDRETSARLELPAVGWRTTDGSLLNPGSEGDYWSSVANGSNRAYYLYFDSSNLYVGSYGKRSGFSVRLVRR